MAEQLIFNGKLNSPFSIFIRQPNAYSDKELLQLFRLGHYKRSPVSQNGRHAIFADAGGWTMLSDDWCYTLWHLPTTKRVIRKLAKSHDIFACSEGDCDRSFDYKYYVDGQLVREYTVHSPRFSDREVGVNRGGLLPNEHEILVEDGYNIGIAVAAGLGIKTQFTDDDLRIFTPPADIEF